MKIRDLKEIGPLQAATKAAPHERTREDRVSLERTREVQATIQSAKLSAGAGRTAQLEALENAVRSGTYRPSAEQIADRILAAAELDARLRSLLG